MVVVRRQNCLLNALVWVWTLNISWSLWSSNFTFTSSPKKFLWRWSSPQSSLLRPRPTWTQSKNARSILEVSKATYISLDRLKQHRQATKSLPSKIWVLHGYAFLCIFLFLIYTDSILLQGPTRCYRFHWQCHHHAWQLASPQTTPYTSPCEQPDTEHITVHSSLCTKPAYPCLDEQQYIRAWRSRSPQRAQTSQVYFSFGKPCSGKEMVSRVACLENSWTKGFGFSENSRQGALTGTFFISRDSIILPWRPSD